MKGQRMKGMERVVDEGDGGVSVGRGGEGRDDAMTESDYDPTISIASRNPLLPSCTSMKLVSKINADN